MYSAAMFYVPGRMYHVEVCGIHPASPKGAGSAVIQLKANLAITGVCDRVGRG